MTTHHFVWSSVFGGGSQKPSAFLTPGHLSWVEGGEPGDSGQFVPSLLMATVPEAGAETRC